MPIYAYRCNSCGFEKDHLQKLSDPVLSTCPECSQETYDKQVTAAGFQLKGNGWYATDFKGGASAASPTSVAPADNAAASASAAESSAEPAPKASAPKVESSN